MKSNDERSVGLEPEEWNESVIGKNGKMRVVGPLRKHKGTRVRNSTKVSK